MRLFVAARPPEQVLKTLAGLARPQRPGLRWVPPSQWHVTLRYFGDSDVDLGVAAGRRVAEAAASGRPAVAELGPKLDSFGGNVLHVPVSGLEELAETISRGTAEVGTPPSPIPFTGHITLARNRGRGSSLDGLTGTPVVGSWEVDEIVLVASVTAGRSGAPNRHEVVTTFPLGPSA
ncbi:MAG: hypothetical protein M3N37_06520 [Actinomycetota bacterium]|nr:hypothetical protein [Actinomycetota bacterium]